MKNIELTKDHKSKLLEMCNLLFPEYKFTLEEDCQLGAYSYSFNNLVFSKLNEKKHLLNGIEIHWFEFCINELCFKILDTRRDYLGLSQLQKFRLLEYIKNHPVDYLYEEFKKLK